MQLNVDEDGKPRMHASAYRYHKQRLHKAADRSSFLPSAITDEMFSLELPAEQPNGFLASAPVSIAVDNSFSPSHTLIQILGQDHKGLIYDMMRTLKDYNTQVVL